MVWNWRLYKDTIHDSKGNLCERLRFIEVYYDKPDGKITGFGGPNYNTGSDTIDLTQYADIKDPTQIRQQKFEYDPIDEKEAIENIKFTLSVLPKALERPILTKADFMHLSGNPDGVNPPNKGDHHG